jgi:hypothetical protein
MDGTGELSMNRVVVPVVLVTSLLFAAALTSADPSPATAPSASENALGAVTGVVMKDGKPAEGMQVRLVLPGRRQTPTTNPTTAGDAKPDKRREVIAQATTDATGRFTLSDVPAGTYRVVAGKRDEGVGAARINVSAGQTAQVNLTVKPAGDAAPRHHKKKSK